MAHLWYVHTVLVHMQTIPDHVCHGILIFSVKKSNWICISASYSSYNPISSLNDKSSVNSRIPPMSSTNTYPPFFNLLPAMNFSLPLPSAASVPISKRSVPSKISKRLRVTAHIRNEILKLKSTKPTVFVWEIQQNLLQNGICTAQTLPNVSDFVCSIWHYTSSIS